MTREYRYWPLTKPIPKGWSFFNDLPLPHGRYSILIVKVDS